MTGVVFLFLYTEIKGTLSILYIRFGLQSSRVLGRKGKMDFHGMAIPTNHQCHLIIIIMYCSNYYSEFSEPIELCDWCQSEERNARHGNSSKKSGAGHDGGIVVTKRSEYTGDHKIKQHDREENSTTSSDQKGKNPSGIPSPRPSTRRYKLLKDVMC
ncbi:hypothetical protein D5086_004835 [Populus alba]|uniref:Uncharacterized protein n=1 Tax=Populus alba TaxID=43335 RepID=A0ACC4CRI8_POPAL